MDRSQVSVGVIGAGAIGGVVAAFLQDAGWAPELVCKHEDTARNAQDPGLRVVGIQGERVVKMKAVKAIPEMSGPKDVIFLATKAGDCVAASKELRPLLSENSAVVSLQNGICEEAIGRVVGRDRVIGCVVGWGATMKGPGVLEITSPGEFVIGNIDGKEDSRLPLVKEMLECVVPTRISDNIMGELYSKLIINSCINSLGAITGQTLGKLLADSQVRRIFIGIMKEAMEVAKAKGIKVEPGGGGKIDYYKFLDGTDFLSELKRHLVIRIIGFKYRRIKSSSLQSLERGRATEVDFLNGFIADQGKMTGVETPLNDAVVAMIKEIESGDRPITHYNLQNPVFLSK